MFILRHCTGLGCHLLSSLLVLSSLFVAKAAFADDHQGHLSHREPGVAVPAQNEDQQNDAASMMNQTTIDLISLRRATKQVHWNVTGPHFYAIHSTTADLAGILAQHTDVIAERSLALGKAVNGNVAHVAKHSKIEDAPAKFTSGDEMVRVIRDRLARMSELLQARIGKLGELDIVSQDLLIAAKTKIDKYHWQFAIQLMN